jgi:hypothetical protein
VYELAAKVRNGAQNIKALYTANLMKDLSCLFSAGWGALEGVLLVWVGTDGFGAAFFTSFAILAVRRPHCIIIFILFCPSYV